MTGLQRSTVSPCKLEHQAQHAVGRRVLGPEVDDHAVVVGGQGVLPASSLDAPGPPPRPRSCAGRRRPRASAAAAPISLRGPISWSGLGREPDELLQVDPVRWSTLIGDRLP